MLREHYIPFDSGPTLTGTYWNSHASPKSDLNSRLGQKSSDSKLRIHLNSATRSASAKIIFALEETFRTFFGFNTENG